MSGETKSMKKVEVLFPMQLIPGKLAFEEAGFVFKELVNDGYEWKVQLPEGWEIQQGSQYYQYITDGKTKDWKAIIMSEGHNESKVLTVARLYQAKNVATA